MREVGIDITDQEPKILMYDTVEASDVTITGAAAMPVRTSPGKRYEDGKLNDPAGKGVDTVRRIRGEIKTRIEAPLADLLPARRPWRAH
jgi:arsenate reductase